MIPHMRLCIDMGSDQIKCACFDGGRCVKIFKVNDLAELKQALAGAVIDQGLLVCSDPVKAQHWAKEISSWGISIKPILCDDFLSHAAPEAKDLLLPDTVAKIYRALSLYPMSDCLVVDFGTTVRYELISKQGKLLGRTTFPFFELLSKAMHSRPLVLEDQSPSPLGQNPIESIDSGCYYGLLGSVERIISEIRLRAPIPSEMITIATGAITERVSWKNPSAELVDHIHPHLILEGLNQIINEGLQK
jgi:pantothenate kinase type III